MILYDNDLHEAIVSRIDRLKAVGDQVGLHLAHAMAGLEVADQIVREINVLGKKARRSDA